MADNTQLDAGSGGDLVVTREISHGGDTSKLPGSFIMGITGSEGAYTAAAIDGDAANGLDVDVTRVGGTVTVDNAGTFAVQVDGAALTALQLIDDPVFTDDTSTHATGTTKVFGIGAVATPTDGSVDANDIGMPAMSLDRRLLVDSQIVGQDADVTIADGGNVISVDWNGTAPPIGAGTEAAALRVTLATDSTGQTSVTSMPANTTATGTLTAPAQTVSITVPPGCSSIGLQITGTWTGQIEFEATTDGTTYIPVYASNNSGDSVNSATGNGVFILPGAGFATARARASALSSGTATIDFNASIGGSGTQLTQSLPSGTNAIGKLAANDGVDIGDVTINGPLGAGTEAGAVRVTLATDSTGLVSVDDNGSSITVDTAAGALDVSGATVTVAGTGTLAVQEDGAALTALQVIDNVVHVDDAAFTLGTDSGVMIMGFAGTQSVNANDAAALACNTSGHLLIQEATALDVSAATVTTTPAVSGGGTEAAAQRVTIASDSTGVLSVDDNGANLSIDFNGTNPTLNTGAVDAGTLRVTVATDDTVTVDNGGTFAVQSTLQTGSNLVGDVGISGARTSGGTTIYRNLDVDETEDEIKGSAGQLYWLHAMNLTASTLYLKFYNATAASVIVGTTTPVMTFAIPTQGDTNGAGFNFAVPNGIAFGTAITVACTTALADADTGAPAANACVLNLGYA